MIKLGRFVMIRKSEYTALKIIEAEYTKLIDRDEKGRFKK